MLFFHVHQPPPAAVSYDKYVCGVAMIKEAPVLTKSDSSCQRDCVCPCEKMHKAFVHRFCLSLKLYLSILQKFACNEAK